MCSASGPRASQAPPASAAVFSLGLLLQELSALLEAGLALIEALEALSDKAGAGSRQVQAVLAGLLKELYQGQPCRRPCRRSRTYSRNCWWPPWRRPRAAGSAAGAAALSALRAADREHPQEVVGALLYPAPWSRSALAS